MEAFREVVKYLEKEQIKKVLILGDIIDYGPHSNEVITCLMDLPWEIIGNIRGNHEEAIIEQKYDTSGPTLPTRTPARRIMMPFSPGT